VRVNEVNVIIDDGVGAALTVEEELSAGHEVHVSISNERRLGLSKIDDKVSLTILSVECFLKMEW